jgi:hypothetical protein
MKFKNLIEFISYCEEVCDSIEDSEELFILSTIASASYINLERLIEDANITLNQYYHWLKEAIKEEMYMSAAQIVTAKQCEIEHYLQLANNVIPQDITEFKYAIIELDLQLNNQYLSNDK